VVLFPVWLILLIGDGACWLPALFVLLIGPAAIEITRTMSQA
jgi:hypothetical protein